MGVAGTFFEKKYDPYGFRAAVYTALKPATFLQTITTSFNYHGSFVVAVIPFFLLVTLPVLSFLYESNGLRYGAILLWTYFLCFLAFHMRLFSRKANVVYGKIKSRVIVIGGGPAGLAAIKECKALGLDVVCYEKNMDIGGVYLFPNPNAGGVWKGVRLTSSAWITSFSDFPPRSDATSTHLMHHEYYEYLKAYAIRFGLLEHIKFGHTVEKLQRCQKGKWHITVSDSTGTELKSEADGVIVCSGTHQKPKDLPVTGAEDFKGEIKLMAECKDPSAFKGKRVLVVGNGESATDFAASVSHNAKRCFLAMRRGKVTFSRSLPCGAPRDFLTTRLRHSIPALIRNWRIYFVRKRRALLSYGHCPRDAVSFNMLDSSKLGLSCQLATKTETFVEPFLEDKLEFRREVSKLQGDSVVYEDGYTEPMDVVVFAHGYDQAFPWLKVDNIPHPGEMYMRMFIPKVGDSLVFCGFARPSIGSIPPIAEMQARYAAMVMAGRRTVPCQLKMGDSIYEQRRESRELFPMIEQPSTAVSYIRYMDFLADQIGCRPRMTKLLTEPSLIYKLMSGPMLGASYRIHGEGASQVSYNTLKEFTVYQTPKDTAMFIGFLLWMFPFAIFSDNRSIGLHNTIF